MNYQNYTVFTENIPVTSLFAVDDVTQKEEKYFFLQTGLYYTLIESEFYTDSESYKKQGLKMTSSEVIDDCLRSRDQL